MAQYNAGNHNNKGPYASENGVYDSATAAAINFLKNNGAISWINNNMPNNVHTNDANLLKPLGIYKYGGLADFTGPAWLDGTKSQPELVLNPDDTKNFLAATDILRSISQTIDLQAMTNQFSLNSAPVGLFDEYNQAVEQMVHIDASFPSVQDRNEIEAAFNNLINTASQYANRK